MRITLEPEQKVVGPLAEMLAIGGVFTVIDWEADEVHPFASVTVTLLLPAVVTVMLCDVAPVDQL